MLVRGTGMAGARDAIDDNERITSDPNVCGGEPIIRGTRVTAGDLAHGGNDRDRSERSFFAHRGELARGEGNPRRF